MLNLKNNQKGFAAFLITILVFTITFSIAVSIFILTYNQLKISRNIISSTKAYYLAEAGIEDALLRLTKGMNWLSSYTLNISDGKADLEISDIIGGSRVITSEGNFSKRIKKVNVVYSISTDKINFYYGAQVGDGGMIMGNGSLVQGNVFSNGSVTGGGTIANSITVAGNGNKIQGINVGENATVHTCENADITGTLYYISGGSIIACNYGAAVDKGPNEIEDIPLPISQSQIDEWLTGAAAGGLNLNDVSISGVQSMGPIQIGTPAQPKNLTLTNNSILKVTGTIYVTGNITTANNSTIELDVSYGPLSGVIIADGVITVENNTTLRGSGQAGSYVLLLSTKNDATNPVINVRNNAGGAIFYTNSGLIFLKNNMTAREITGYKIQIENNTEIQYESGLQEATFTSGPGGSWEVVSWREIP